jgi:succinyl-diaminopimelate desuccinylase
LFKSPATKKIDIIFNGHVDVVMADQDQFQPKISGKRVYGRGAYDMKAGLAAIMLLARNNFRKMPHALLIATDEEIGGKNGCGEMSRKIGCNYFLTAEPTDLRLGEEEKGVIWAIGRILGEACHASTPWKGENPIFKLEKVLGKIRKDFPARNGWKTSVTPTVVEMANSQNQVAGELKVKIDSRFIPQDGADKTIKRLKGYFDELIIQSIDPELAPIKHAYTEKLKIISAVKTVRMDFASDARFFYRQGIPAVIFGPAGANMHGKEEWVDIESLATFYKILDKWIKSIYG